MKIGNLPRHTLSRFFLLALLTLACLYNAKAQCPASSPLVINSVNPTESRCQASGTATVSVSGGSAPYTYSITAGPITAPAQSSNILQSLPAGTYTAQVTDNCGTSVTSSFTIPGTYVLPAPTISTQGTSCPGSTDGSITFSVANGLAPFTYSLISPSTVTAGPQTSNVFSGLPAGTYTCQVADSCGNFQTRTVTVAAGSAGTVAVTSTLNYVSCNTYTLSYFILGTSNPPFTVSLTLPNGTVTTQVISGTSGTFDFTFDHVTGNTDPLYVKVTSNCGISNTETLDLSTLLDLSAVASPSTNCTGSYMYTVDNTNATQYHCAPITYTLVSPSGVVLATQTNNPTFSGYPPGTGYKVIRTDCCETNTLTFNWTTPSSSPTLFLFTDVEAYGTCKDGTAGVDVAFANVTTSWDIILASGPASVTFADGTVYTFPYPDTLQMPASTNTALIPSLPAGTYKIIVVDDCGDKDSTTVTITPSQLRHNTFTAKAVTGCPGVSEILLNATDNSNSIYSYAYVTEIATDGSYYNISNPTGSPWSSSITGLSSGSYDLTFNYEYGAGGVYTLNGMGAIACDVIDTTVVVPVSTYINPAFASSPAVANCGSVQNVALLPDSASGIQPYEFQITAGPATTSAQSSPVFTDLSSGTYTFQMTDACDDSYSKNITINTLTLPAMSTTGGGCVAGSAATFTLPASPFYNYTWLHPDGTTTTGDTLSYNPITNADTGMYTITLTSTVGGCTSTATEKADLGFCTILAENLLNFTGQPVGDNIQLNWETAGGSTTGYFIVQRSEDGIGFVAIQQLGAAGGETSHTYTMTDTHVPSGNVYYRLAMVDISGSVSYSQILSFNIGQQQAVNVYPRLITGNTLLTGTYPATDGNAYFRVIGVDGRIWRTIALAAGTTQTTIDVTGLPRGNYFIVFTTPDNVVPMQVWKE